ncbi:MAG: glycosyltransferase family 2 protein [Muribaculaceae bacterium]
MISKLMPTLTVFTPAYNRAHTIGRTYESLCRQTCKDFLWMVIDDGSTDGTRQLIEQWIADAVIPIKYIYQDNQGMHGAHNTAYRNISTELNTCIDSDDYMPDDAVEQIVEFWKTHGSDRYAGIIGLDATADGKIIGTGFYGLQATTLTDFYARGGKGDKKLVYRTDVIRRYPEYPLFEGERYVGLAYKYMLIDQDYQLLTLEKPLVIVEYQPDGSSFGMYRQYWNNPRGFAFYRLTEMQFAPTLKRRFMVCIHYVASSIIARNHHFISESNQKALTILAIPFGIALYLVIRHKVKTNKKMNF